MMTFVISVLFEVPKNLETHLFTLVCYTDKVGYSHVTVRNIAPIFVIDHQYSLFFCQIEGAQMFTCWEYMYN